jgi:hypothetical protein
MRNKAQILQMASLTYPSLALRLPEEEAKNGRTDHCGEQTDENSSVAHAPGDDIQRIWSASMTSLFSAGKLRQRHSCE